MPPTKLPSRTASRTLRAFASDGPKGCNEVHRAIHEGGTARRVTLVALVLVAAVLLLGTRATSAAPSPEEGKRIFETRCVACHTLGGGVLVGPDLQGVAERRDRDWLVRFILEPDRLRQEGDVIARANLEEYRTPMPSFGLPRQEVEDVVAYLAIAKPAGSALPAAYLPTLAIAVIALLVLTVVALRAGSKRVEVRS